MFNSELDFYITIIAIKSYQTSVDQLIETLPPQYKLIIIYQNEPEDSYQIQDNGNIIINQRRNIFEYGWFTALKYGFDNQLFKDTSKFLLLQSTMKLTGGHEESTQRIENLLSEMDDSHIYFLCGNGQFNICIIDKIGIEAVAPFYDGLETLEKTTAIEWEIQEIQGKSPRLAQTNVKIHPDMVYGIKDGESKKYGNTIRHTTIIPSLGAEKYNIIPDEIERTRGHELFTIN
jgi:hypothetical protein